MKIYISGYRDHWYSPYPIMEKFYFWKKDYDAYKEEPPAWLQSVCEHVKWVLDKIHPYVNYVKIDKYDTWSMDSTLAHIILPMLKQLKATKHGAPFVDDMDVPDILKSTSAAPKENDWDTDANWHLRWDWILQEEIFAFEQLGLDWEHQYKSGVSDTDWVESDEVYEGDTCWEMKHGPNHTMVYDWEGMKTHNDRIQNGFRLFGKYYTSLWD